MSFAVIYKPTNNKQVITYAYRGMGVCVHVDTHRYFWRTNNVSWYSNWPSHLRTHRANGTSGWATSSTILWGNLLLPNSGQFYTKLVLITTGWDLKLICNSILQSHIDKKRYTVYVHGLLTDTHMHIRRGRCRTRTELKWQYISPQVLE